eukprot:gene24633-26490_t
MSDADLPNGASVVVIGAGVTGLSAAWWLARSGIDVVVLDKGIVGWEASGRNGGGASHYQSPLFAEEQRLWPQMDELLGYPTEYVRERIIIQRDPDLLEHYRAERELGVALVELGAGITNVSLFAGGMLVGLMSIPIGAQDITDDIASAFGTRRAQAERMKCVHGSANASPRDNHEMIDVAPISAEDDAHDGTRITKAQLISVIRQRLDHLIGEVGKALAELKFEGPVGRQVVLTGGGAELKGIADYAQQALGRSVRIGRPRGLTALPEAHAGPAFATLAGLAFYAAADPVDLRGLSSKQQLVHRPKGFALFRRLIAAARANY